jgi:glycosyltransferase involved in cell wall biosynthesis
MPRRPAVATFGPMPEPKDLRTLFVAERFPPFPGGVAASAGRIARAIAATWGPTAVLALDPGLPAGTVASGGEPDLPVTRVGAAGSREAVVAAALRHAATVPAEVVFGHFAGEAGFLAVLHGRLTGARSVVSIRGNDLDRGALGDDGFARLVWTLERAHLVAAVTREHARKAAALAGRDHVWFTPNVVDTSRFLPPPGPGREDDEAVGFSGELRPRKGLFVLLDALALLATARPRVRLLLLGGVHPAAREAFAAAVREKGLASRIREVPFRAEPSGLAADLASCRVLAFPSLADGMPNALLEAMAVARPCVATAVGGAPDAIEDGRSGILVPPGDAPALAGALDALLGDPDRARSLGEAARRRVERCFGPAREREDLLALRNALAAGARSGTRADGGIPA